MTSSLKVINSSKINQNSNLTAISNNDSHMKSFDMKNQINKLNMKQYSTPNAKMGQSQQKIVRSTGLTKATAKKGPPLSKHSSLNKGRKTSKTQDKEIGPKIDSKMQLTSAYKRIQTTK